MGQLIEGKWHNDWYDTESTGGKFIRPNKNQFRNRITEAERGRYHLYVSYACPWAHRTLIFRELKGLQGVISVSVVNPIMLDQGWTFKDYQYSSKDHLYGSDHLYQIYQKADSHYTGRVTVPLLWDKKEETIVNNESSDIIRIFNKDFDELTGNDLDFYPLALRDEIHRINDIVYEGINNGVYKCGFATTQEAYEEAFVELFAALDQMESLLEERKFLCGDQVTEADWRLFTTLLRFDSVYYGHFKCNKRQIREYPELWDYLRCLYQVPRIAATCFMSHIKTHYYYSHTMINPTQVIPLGPDLDFTQPTRRGVPKL